MINQTNTIATYYVFTDSADAVSSLDVDKKWFAFL